MDVLNQNTRAIGCMEKTVNNQNQIKIMKALNDSIKSDYHQLSSRGKKKGKRLIKKSRQPLQRPNQ